MSGRSGKRAGAPAGDIGMVYSFNRSMALMITRIEGPPFGQFDAAGFGQFGIPRSALPACRGAGQFGLAAIVRRGVDIAVSFSTITCQRNWVWTGAETCRTSSAMTASSTARPSCPGPNQPRSPPFGTGRATEAFPRQFGENRRRPRAGPWILVRGLLGFDQDMGGVVIPLLRLQIGEHLVIGVLQSLFGPASS